MPRGLRFRRPSPRKAPRPVLFWVLSLMMHAQGKGKSKGGKNAGAAPGVGRKWQVRRPRRLPGHHFATLSAVASSLRAALGR